MAKGRNVPIFITPLDVAQAFYRAFEAGDVDELVLVPARAVEQE